MVAVVAQYRVKRHRQYPAGARVYHLSDGNRYVDQLARPSAASRTYMRSQGWIA